MIYTCIERTIFKGRAALKDGDFCPSYQARGVSQCRGFNDDLPLVFEAEQDVSRKFFAFSDISRFTHLTKI